MKSEMPTGNENAAINERVGRLETSVDALHGELGEIKSSLRAITDAIGKSKETNWGVWIAGAALAGAVYAAAVRPMSNDAEKLERTAGKIADAVLVQNDKISDHRVKIAIIEWRLDHP